MMNTIKKQKGKWYNAVDEYREELGITWDDILAMDRKCLKDIIRTYDTDKWREGLDMKASMKIYSLEKEKIGYEFCYNNNISSKIYARARINALQLEEHKGRGKENYDATCKRRNRRQ